MITTATFQGAEDAVVGVASGPARSPLPSCSWWTPAVAAAWRRVDDGRRARRSAPGAAAADAADAALAAAAARYAEVKAAAIAEAAHELLLGQDPGSHEARRLHGIIQTEILGRAARGATHEWDAVRAADGSVVRGAAGVEARLSEWTAELHAERRDDPRYSESEYARLEYEHSEWERRSRDRECDESLRSASDGARWARFELDADAGVVFGPAEWSTYLASAVRQFEVAAAIAASSSATSPSPADGVCPPALKCGGWYLELALAAVFDVAMRTGAVPASWRTGYVRWLFKKGDELDPSCFRGIVLTSLARAFASTFGEFFAAHASEITALPPRRST